MRQAEDVADFVDSHLGGNTHHRCSATLAAWEPPHPQGQAASGEEEGAFSGGKGRFCREALATTLPPTRAALSLAASSL